MDRRCLWPRAAVLVRARGVAARWGASLWVVLLLGVLPPGLAGAASAASPAASAPVATRPALGSGVAVAPDGRLWWVGLDEVGRLFVRHTAGPGQDWSPPRWLEADSRISADGENRPKIAFGPPGTPAAGQVVITYTQPLARPYTGAVRLLRSSDGGERFSAPSTVHADRQEITHRFDAVAFDAAGALHVAWIDKRDVEEARAGGRAYRGAALYRAVSHDGGAHFGPDTRVADHSCECCRIALSPAPGGGMAALWRHVFAPNERDHAFARWSASPDAPATPSVDPVRATEDGWRLDACPHHGPGLSPAAGGGWHAVWFGVRGLDAQAQAAVRVGRLDGQGRPAGPVQVLPDPAAEHADIASAGEQVVVVWRSFDGDRTRLRAWVSTDGGRQFRLREIDATPLDNDHPRLLVRGGRFLVFWRTRQGAVVHDVPLS
ncbi:hypothetical protein [Ideonella sp.]|uniref:hypothetical protein n=1 Tax=Ideonella sp. TaxID=1929293 RepID=UPI0035B1CABE